MQEAFLREKPLLELQPPLVVAGSIHGCADQLHHIFRSSGGLEASQCPGMRKRGRRDVVEGVLNCTCPYHCFGANDFAFFGKEAMVGQESGGRDTEEKLCARPASSPSRIISAQGGDSLVDVAQ